MLKAVWTCHTASPNMLKICPLGSNWERSAALLLNMLALEASFSLAWLNLHAPIQLRNMIYSSKRFIVLLLLIAKLISSNVNIKWKFCLIYWNDNIFLSLKWISRTPKLPDFDDHHRDCDSDSVMEAFFPRRP